MGFLRLDRLSMAAAITIVTFLSPWLMARGVAQNSDSTVTVRMGALSASLSETGPRTGPRARPVHSAFQDEDTSWILPPPPLPDAIETTGVLQCVPYARFMSGISLRGDAWTWWDKAAGIYARGNQPEPGAVLSFPGTERMPLGHVAVVTQVLNDRTILIDHANWPTALILHGAISRDVEVVDVSSGNDWSMVRVQFGEGGPLGSVYPVNGFIYGWTETGVRIARPRFSLDYALWSPMAPSLRMFNSISYLWALPPTERKKAYAAAGVVPQPESSVRGRPVLVLGPTGPVLNAGSFGQTLGVNRLDVGPGGRAGFGVGRYVTR